MPVSFLTILIGSILNILFFNFAVVFEFFAPKYRPVKFFSRSPTQRWARGGDGGISPPVGLDHPGCQKVGGDGKFSSVLKTFLPRSGEKNFSGDLFFFFVLRTDRPGDIPPGPWSPRVLGGISPRPKIFSYQISSQGSNLAHLWEGVGTW